MTKISTATRNKVAQAAAGRPILSVWIDTICAISPEAEQAVEGIWCGEDGTERLEFCGRYIVVGWHLGRVEYSYVS